jgi:hypothetical protein
MSNINSTGIGCFLVPIPTGNPPPTPIGVSQNGGALTFETSLGNATGTINQGTGDFSVQVVVPASTTCPYGCSNVTTGRFALGSSPMTFTGSGRIDVKGPTGSVICQVTYNASGTRTACPTLAQVAGWAWLWLPGEGNCDPPDER